MEGNASSQIYLYRQCIGEVKLAQWSMGRRRQFLIAEGGEKGFTDTSWLTETSRIETIISCHLVWNTGLVVLLLIYLTLDLYRGGES